MTHNEAIFNHLLKGNSLSGLETLYLCGSMKLSSRIGEIKQDMAINKMPYQIKDQFISNGKSRFKIYWMENES